MSLRLPTGDTQADIVIGVPDSVFRCHRLCGGYGVPFAWG
jgi:hypothetical protein